MNVFNAYDGKFGEKKRCAKGYNIKRCFSYIHRIHVFMTGISVRLPPPHDTDILFYMCIALKNLCWFVDMCAGEKYNINM